MNSEIQLTNKVQQDENHFENNEEDVYYPYKIPPDWKFALKHALSRRFANASKNLSDSAYCPCCGYQIDRDDIDIFEENHNLNYMGPGIPVYFNMFKYILILLFESLIVSGILNIVTNLFVFQCKHEKIDDRIICLTNITALSSIINQNNPQLLLFQSFGRLVYVSLAIATIIIMRKVQRDTRNQLDESAVSPQDYSIFVDNIHTGLEFDYKEKLTNIFELYSVQGEKIKVSKIVLIQDMTQLYEHEELIQNLIQQIKLRLPKLNYDNQHPEIKLLKSKIRTIGEKNKEEEILRVNDFKYFIGSAIISFQTEKQKQLVLKRNKYSWREELMTFIKDQKKIQLKPTDLQLEGHKLFCQLAPEPNEIDWTKIYITSHHRMKLHIIAFCVYLIYFSAFFVLVIVIASFQKGFVEIQEYTPGSNSHENFVDSKTFKFFSWGQNLLIMLFNQIGQVFLNIKLCKYECFISYSQFSLYLTWRNTFISFSNLAFLNLVISYTCYEENYRAISFIENQTHLMLLNAILPVLFSIIDVRSRIKKSQLAHEIFLGPRCVLTQEEANKLAEFPEYHQATRYCIIVSTFLVCLIYAGSIPFINLYSMSGLMILYIIDRYNLFTRRTVKSFIGIHLADSMLDFVELCIPLQCLGDLLFITFTGKEINAVDIICAVFGTIYMLIPKLKLNELIFPLFEVDEIMLYEEAQKKFYTDYDLECPTTRQAALKQHKQQFH